MGKTDERAARQELFEKIADALAAHSEIEEKILYPSVYVGPLQSKVNEAVKELLAAKRVIADLLKLEPVDEQLEAKMKVLQEEFEHHVNEEEGDLFPQVRRTSTAPSSKRWAIRWRRCSTSSRGRTLASRCPPKPITLPHSTGTCLAWKFSVSTSACPTRKGL